MNCRLPFRGAAWGIWLSLLVLMGSVISLSAEAGGPPAVTTVPYASPHGAGHGMPMAPAYRWGWFGAGRYDPRVVWHCGYYGDCVRWVYRPAY